MYPFPNHQQHQPSISSYPSTMPPVSGIQGQLLEITVVGCTKLKDTEWISRQDPYVWLEYGSTKSRTRTCTDGGKNPTFQEKFLFNLIEGLREINLAVWNSNTLSYDDFIGSGKVQLHTALLEGYDDRSWPLQTKTGRHAGEVRLIIHYGNANKPASNVAHSAPMYGAASAPHAPLYSTPPPLSAPPYAPPPHTAYPTSSAYPSYPPSAYPPSAYPVGQPSAYPPSAYPVGQPSAYPPSAYPPSAYPVGQPSAYPPSAYPVGQPSAYPPSAYPPSAYPQHSAYPPSAYPPPPQGSLYYPPSPFPGLYPPPPY